MAPSWVKFHGTNPVPVSLSWHYEFRLVNCPYLPEHIVTACSNDRLFGMKDHCTNWHSMSLLSFSQNCLFIVKWLWRACRRSLILGKWSEFNLFIVWRRFLNRRKGILLLWCFGFQLISLNFDEHLFLHGEVVLLSELFIFLLIFLLKRV